MSCFYSKCDIVANRVTNNRPLSDARKQSVLRANIQVIFLNRSQLPVLFFNLNNLNLFVPGA